MMSMNFADWIVRAVVCLIAARIHYLGYREKRAALPAQAASKPEAPEVLPAIVAKVKASKPKARATTPRARQAPRASFTAEDLDPGRVLH